VRVRRSGNMRNARTAFRGALRRGKAMRPPGVEEQ
jgi:hypothetical protein